MKFKTLAIAIAAATVSTAAMADSHMGAPEFKISGDVTVGYFDNGTGDKSFGGNGSEVIFDASQKVGGLTYFGSMTANFYDTISGGNVATDDLYVGVKGAFGEVRMGDTDNGCDAMDDGWVVDDMFISHSSGGCSERDQNNLTYRGSRGPVSYAVGYSPDVDAGSTAATTAVGQPGEDMYSVGVKGKVGPATVSLGYETAGDYDNTVLGVAGRFGPVAVGIRASKQDNNDTNVGYTAQYSTGANKMYIGYGDVNDDENTLFLGYQRAIGSNTIFAAEYVNIDGATEDQYAIGVKHSF